MERHRLVDLLPERSSESLGAWLKQHPHIEVVSRDRAGTYADGARQGAPQAQQVADRWHLLRNLGEAMERLAAQHGRSLRQAAEQLSPTPEPQPIRLETPAPSLPPALVEQRRLQRCEKRLAQYTQVKQLRQQGWTIASIAAEVGVSKRTADRFLQAEQYPERARRRRQPRNTDPYLPYIQQRVAQGCRSAQQLYGEIKGQGYTGSYASVYHLFQSLAPKPPGALEPKSVSKQKIGPEPRERRKRGRASPHVPVEVPPSRTVAWWLQGHLSSHAERRAQQDTFLKALYTLVPLLREAAELAQEFRRLLKQGQVEPLNEWLKKASASVCTEIKRFAQGLYQDLSAVQNAVTMQWSNGQTEGQVNRLKMLKRQMYGRANFDLLRARVLPMM